MRVLFHYIQFLELHRYAGTASSEARLFLRKFLEKYGIELLDTNIIKMKNEYIIFIIIYNI